MQKQNRLVPDIRTDDRVAQSLQPLVQIAVIVPGIVEIPRVLLQKGRHGGNLCANQVAERLSPAEEIIYLPGVALHHQLGGGVQGLRHISQKAPVDNASLKKQGKQEDEDEEKKQFDGEAFASAHSHGKLLLRDISCSLYSLGVSSSCFLKLLQK